VKYLKCLVENDNQLKWFNHQLFQVQLTYHKSNGKLQWITMRVPEDKYEFHLGQLRRLYHVDDLKLFVRVSNSLSL
jgi:hypothetical protein